MSRRLRLIVIWVELGEGKPTKLITTYMYNVFDQHNVTF